jgi:short-chain fatty acids transporter
MRFICQNARLQPFEPADSRFSLAKIAATITTWMERWFPDSFVFALLLTVFVFVASCATGRAAFDIVKDFGDGFWGLVPFTMQMVMVILGGFVMASSPPVRRLISFLARIPSSARSAVAFVAVVATTTSLISYGFSLMFSGFLVREISQRPLKADYRALGAAAYLGLGSVWALGLSSSAALMMTTASAIPQPLLKISGVIPLSDTIYTWQSVLTAVILILVSVVVAYFSAPTGGSSRTRESLGVAFEPAPATAERKTTPANWLEQTPILTVLIVSLGLSFLAHKISEKGWLSALNLDTYNLLFLMLGLLFHWRPASFSKAASEAAPATTGVLIQFPFYAGIFGMISFSPISKTFAGLFLKFSNHDTYPVLVSIYSGFLGFFVPSGGGKWMIEAPYVLSAAQDLHVSPGWIVQVYNTSEALPNLINPFWMLPLLGILKLKARDLAGYGLLQLLVCGPIVLFLMWFLGRTFPVYQPLTPQ